MGVGWFRPEAVAKYVARTKHPGATARFGLVARDVVQAAGSSSDESGPIAAALLAQVITPGTALAESFVAGYDEVADDPRVVRLNQAPAGLITAVAVEPRARQRGIASSLLARGVDEMARRGARGFYALAWTTQARGCHLGGVLARHGFETVRRFEEPYRDFSLRYNCHCPFCGQPCRCSAWLYIRLAADRI